MAVIGQPEPAQLISLKLQLLLHYDPPRQLNGFLTSRSIDPQTPTPQDGQIASDPS